MSVDLNVDLVVLGAGPGGYTAAFRAADLGLKTAIVEKHSVLGGVCLNVGCVPSKALLHATSLVESAKRFAKAGIFSDAPSCNLEGLQTWKSQIVRKLNRGLEGLAKRRKIVVLTGQGKLVSQNELVVSNSDGATHIRFEKAIIATGSHAASIPFLPVDECIWNSTQALSLPFVPKRLLVIGGGVIGLEMATVYERLGSEVTIVEMADSLLPGVDKEAVRPLFLALKKTCSIFTESMVQNVSRRGDHLAVSLEGPKCPSEIKTDAILVSIGRKPNVDGIGLESAGISLGDHGQIIVDEQQRTSQRHIFAIGDVTPGPMLAHRASAEGKIAAEVAAGMDTRNRISCIPQVAYTSPEVASVGMTEMSAKEAGIAVGIGKFPFAASARAMTVDEPVGFVKLVVNTNTSAVIGAEMVGPHVGELIAEIALAIQNGLTVDQLTRTVHPHPSLSESILMSAEAFEGTITDLYIPKAR